MPNDVREKPADDPTSRCLMGLGAALIAFLFFFPSTAFSAEASFFTLNDRWEKANAAPATSKKTALEQGFGNALEKTSFKTSAGLPEPPVLKRILSQLARDNQTVEIQLNQSLYVQASSGVTKFIATNEGIVSLETVGEGNVRLVGVGIGRTFVHIWDVSGRNTFEVQVIPQTIVLSSTQLRRIEAFEKTRSFRLGYSHSRGSFYTGPKFRDKSRASLDFSQNFTMEGDTPYGAVSSEAQTQKDRGKTLLTDAQFHLKDGRIGPFKDFNANLGDNRVKPNLMVFPAARVRGYEIDHTDAARRVKWDSFYGREQSSVIGTLTPGIVTKKTQNSYLSGNLVDFKVNDDMRLKAGFFTGSGKSRPDDLNRKGAGFESEFQLGPHVKFNPEIDYDNERFAQKHSVTTRFDKLTFRTETRDIDSHFETLIGAPSRQGEKGTLFELTADPYENVNLSGTFDIFRDRLIPNPNDAKAYNTHTDLLLRMIPRERSSLLFTFQDLDDTGRLGPNKQRTFGTQFNQQFAIFSHKASGFSRYQYRASRNINNPLSDYEDHQFILGFQTEIFWGIQFSLSQEWNRLDEYNLLETRMTHPRILVYSFDYSHKISDTPFYMEARLRIRDEEETESRNSFMTGEDSAELSGGIYYREYENMELFLTGRFKAFVPESLNVIEPRIEAEFLTGMRYLFDTQTRWSTVGSFEGFVFKDLNGDGVRQPDEPGIEGMAVKANDGKEAVTDKQGFYELKSISGKNAALVLDSAKIPYGFAPTSDVRREAPITQGQTEQVDFGLMPRSEITGIIFNDLNGNGKYDSTDSGVRKVRVKLEDGASARSNTIGVYSFPVTLAGEHTAALDLSTLPDGYLPQDVPKKTFTVFEGIRFELNFPLRATRQITGRVFIDENDNAVMDPNEKPLSNVKVLLGPKEVLTDKDGWYLFDNLNSGVYFLSADPGTLPDGLQGPVKISLELTNEPITISDKNIPIVRAVKHFTETE